MPKKPEECEAPEGVGVTSPHLSQQSAQGAHWASSSDSLSEGSDPGGTRPRGTRRWLQALRQLPTKEYFKILVSEVREACKAEIANVRQDLKQVSERVEALEGEHDTTRKYVSQLKTHIASQDKMLQETRLHLEDLDNRGRRNNIRVRGLQESDTSENLTDILESIFNGLLDVPSENRIPMDRAHRALRPKKPNGPPRDVICRLTDFATKEQIMQAARSKREIKFEDSTIQLFPDLAWITLQRRRHLKPLVTLLRERNIAYRWGFPFSLTAIQDGKPISLRSYVDLPSFCSALGLETPTLSDWDLGLLTAAPAPVWQPARQKRRRFPSRGSSGQRSPAAT